MSVMEGKTARVIENAKGNRTTPPGPLSSLEHTEVRCRATHSSAHSVLLSTKLASANTYASKPWVNRRFRWPSSLSRPQLSLHMMWRWRRSFHRAAVRWVARPGYVAVFVVPLLFSPFLAHTFVTGPLDTPPFVQTPRHPHHQHQ